MKRIKHIPFIILASVLYATGCVKVVIGTGDVPAETGEAIILSAGVPSKAAVDADKNGMESFAVWGGYDSQNNLFNSVEVTKDGYYEGTRYWVTGKTHNFYALHPAGLSSSMPGAEVSCSDEGIITVENFDTSKTGPEAVDLMTASATGIIPEEGKYPGSVSFQFSHELARVKFSVTANQRVTISDVALRGVIYKATFTSFQSSPDQTWTELNITNEADTPPFTQAEGGTISGGDTQTIDLLGGDLLLIPQRITRICGFSMTWTHENGTSETVNIPLDFETGVTHWEAGKSYNYKAKIRDESTVIFNVTIKDWTEEDYTVDW